MVSIPADPPSKDMAIVIVTIVIGVVAATLMLSAVSDVLCLVRSLGRRRPRPDSTALPRLLFLVPAHNEEQLIESCVRSLRTLRLSGRSVDGGRDRR